MTNCDCWEKNGRPELNEYASPGFKEDGCLQNECVAQGGDRNPSSRWCDDCMDCSRCNASHP